MDVIEEVRAFNRFYTRVIGLLDEDLGGTGFGLTETRVLFELDARKRCTASDIAGELHLDAGYLSRLLGRFEREGWVRRDRSEVDRRASVLSLTAAGRAVFRPLRTNARQRVRELLGPLSELEREELLRSLGTVRTLLGDDRSAEVVLRDLRTGDTGWVVHRQAQLYAHEHGWDITYEALVARILADFVDGFDPDWEQAWIAERDGRIVGSVFLVRSDDPGVGKLRLLYVEPSERGAGLGRRLVDECISGARSRGYRTLQLWTNDVLVSARRIYQAAGFEMVRSGRHRAFGHDLVEQTWELPLSR